MTPILIDDSQYYNDELLEFILSILLAFKSNAVVDVHFHIFESGYKRYSYMMSTYATKDSYALDELQKWVDAGALVDAIETYHNVHKSIYGIRPRIGSPEQWADIEWVRAQTADCIAREDSYLQEQEHMND